MEFAWGNFRVLAAARLAALIVAILTFLSAMLVVTAIPLDAEITWKLVAPGAEQALDHGAIHVG
jgi:hypothetical protein